MNKLKGRIPDCQLDGTDSVIFSGDLPECITSTDCSVNTSSLTYLITLLLERYCEQENIIDADMSSVDITCLIAANPDIELPEDITVETLATFFKDHICALYTKVSDLTTIVDNQLSLICSNDIVQLDQDSSLVIDVLFNDYTSQVPGSLVLTIQTSPINGSVVINVDKTITYTPNADFFGNDSFIYKIVKGTRECTAKVSIKVNKVITEDDLNTIVTTNIIDILQSNEYWDIGIPIGTKWAISEENLVDFNFLVVTPGKGKTGTKWKKWAICNGFNDTEDFTKSTFRGFDHTDSDYSFSGLQGGSDTFTLVIANLPRHRHKYLDGYIQGNGGGTFASARYEAVINAMPNPPQQSSAMPTTTFINDGASGGDNWDTSYSLRNTGDGFDNLGNQGGLSSTPAAVTVRNDYKTLILIQKVE